MPYKYAVECICDKLAATKTYAKGDYNESLPLLHWQRYGSRAQGNERLKLFIETVFTDLMNNGERYVLNGAYMKKTYARICLAEQNTDTNT